MHYAYTFFLGPQDLLDASPHTQNILEQMFCEPGDNSPPRLFTCFPRDEGEFSEVRQTLEDMGLELVDICRMPIDDYVKHLRYRGEAVE